MACLDTFCTLTILSASLAPDDITAELNIQPANIHAKDPSSPYRPRREYSSWKWTTQGSIDSTDYRDHLQNILEVFAGKGEALEKLRNSDCTTCISCFMDVAGNTEIPLERPTIATLERLGLDIWWDVYPTTSEPQSKS